MTQNTNNNKLQEHQQRAIDKIKSNKSTLIYHNMGSGKTLLSLAAAEQLNLPLSTIGPASLKANFAKERQKHNIHLPGPVKSYSYAKPPSPEETANKLLVFDEAHNMGRLESKRSKYPDQYNNASKKVFLTGTPIRNEPSELIPLLRGLDIDVPRDRKKFEKKYIKTEKQYPSLWGYLKGVKPGEIKKATNLDDLKKKLKNKVDYYEQGSENFPKVTEKHFYVEMSPEQQKAYDMALKGKPTLSYKIRHGISPDKAESGQMNAFLAAARQISNSPSQYSLKATPGDEPKINTAYKQILKKMREDPEYRGVTYSNYLSHGLNPMEQRLKSAKIPYAVFTGKQSPSEKKQIVNDYNSGKIKHLLLSSSGAEGLDLKGTRMIQILEPHWNKEKIKQIIGRGVRYKSHENLSPEKQSVEVQKFYADPRKRWYQFNSRDMGADQYLDTLSKRKAELNSSFLNALKEVGNGNGTN